MKILIIGVHPDDVEIGMGGIIAKLSSKHEITVLVLSDGEPTPFGTIEKRKSELEKSMNILGCKFHVLGLKNREIMDTIEARKMIGQEIRKEIPDVIFTLSGDEKYHPDHIYSEKLVNSAIFYAKLSKTDIMGEPLHVKNVLYYESINTTSKKPCVMVDISEQIETKFLALQCYISQFNNADNREYLSKIKTYNKYLGGRIGVKYSEKIYFDNEINIDFLKVLL